MVVTLFVLISYLQEVCMLWLDFSIGFIGSFCSTHPVVWNGQDEIYSIKVFSSYWCKESDGPQKATRLERTHIYIHVCIYILENEDTNWSNQSQTHKIYMVHPIKATSAETIFFTKKRKGLQRLALSHRLNNAFSQSWQHFFSM